MCDRALDSSVREPMNPTRGVSKYDYTMTPLPRLLITMGDVAGVGPEIIAAGWPQLLAHCRPVVVGDPAWLRRAAKAVGARLEVAPADVPPSADVVPCLTATGADLGSVEWG